MRFAYALGTVALVGLLACGGKVIWVGDWDGGAGGEGTTSSHASTGTVSTSSFGACLTSASTGGGPLGPNMIHTTKCIPIGASQPCPAAVTIGGQLDPDPCYALESVDVQCISPEPGKCCYDVTEQLVCKG
jgi:hypothetical protein